MAAVQTNYGTVHARWIEGMVLDSSPHDIISRTVEDVEGIGFGKVAVQGDLDDTITDSEAAKKFVGISILDTTKVGDIYAQYDTVNIMRRGNIVVMASVAVAVNDPVYFVPATGVLTNVAAAGANTLIANAFWETSTGAAGLAAIRLNI